MSSFALIVFREILEIALVLGIVLAATKGLPSRGIWIWSGLALGILGSIGVAIFTEQISQALEGFGQEFLNAIILFSAAVLIAWTVVWMKIHGRHLAARMKKIGADVACGKRHLSVLCGLIALTVLREGSEIVLLGHGILVSNPNILRVISGGVIGFICGASVGAAIYLGIIGAGKKYIFEVTSWLLIFLCAGMVSQALGYLAAADIIPYLTFTVWDSSWLLSEQTWLGEIFQVLVGYSSRPLALQLLGWTMTLLLVSLGFYRIGNTPQTNKVEPN